MTDRYSIAAAVQRGDAKPGQYVTVDPSGRIVRITDIITSWAAMTYEVQADGTIQRVA